MVQFVNIREMKNRLSEIIRRAKRGDVVVTSRGRPKAILHGIQEEELEDYLLAHSKKFQESLKASYREYKRTGGVSLEILIAQTEKEIARLRR